MIDLAEYSAIDERDIEDFPNPLPVSGRLALVSRSKNLQFASQARYTRIQVTFLSRYAGMDSSVVMNNIFVWDDGNNYEVPVVMDYYLNFYGTFGFATASSSKVNWVIDAQSDLAAFHMFLKPSPWNSSGGFTRITLVGDEREPENALKILDPYLPDHRSLGLIELVSTQNHPTRGMGCYNSDGSPYYRSYGNVDGVCFGNYITPPTEIVVTSSHSLFNLDELKFSPPDFLSKKSGGGFDYRKRPRKRKKKCMCGCDCKTIADLNQQLLEKIRKMFSDQNAEIGETFTEQTKFLQEQMVALAPKGFDYKPITDGQQDIKHDIINALWNGVPFDLE